MRSFLQLVLATAAISMFLGCGSGETIPELVPVTGTITINGSPGADLTVTFNPTGQEDVGASVGTTDAQGNYTLLYKGEHSGAPAGSYRVSIHQMNEADVPDGQLLPPHYNRETQLTAEVSANSAKHDFALQTGAQ